MTEPGPIRIPALGVRRWAFLGLVSATTTWGGWMMLGIVGAGGIGALEAVILGLFLPTFGWITIPFWTAVVGFVLRLGRIDPLTLRRRTGAEPDGPIHARTAVVMPVHNEDPDRVLGRFAATLRSTAATGHGDRFDFFLLSDTTDPRIAREEQSAWEAFSRDTGVPGRLAYRRRPHNKSQKAGNIREFCDRWGGDYDLMVVLDADSTMSGGTLVSLVRMMEANPDVGLIQTTPLPYGQTTLFGELLQSGAHLLSPVMAAGHSFWHGDAGNYWGHNAILRMRPFMELTTLPVLPGRPPLGGEILSHDFVEAALLRKGGWGVLFLSELDGSWEEVPPTLPEYVKRDRRWAQGSLQHLRLLTLPGLHPLSRYHLFAGAMAYLSSVLWFLLLAAGTVYVVGAELGWRVVDAEVGTGSLPLPTSSFSLLGLTAAILFLPKLLGLALALAREPSRFGGAGRLCVTALLELVFAVILAPVLMIHQVRAVVAILSGRSIEWGTGQRDAVGASWRSAWREGRTPMAVGIVWSFSTAIVSLEFLAWLSPILVGLIFAVPLVRWTAGPRRDPADHRPRLLRVRSGAPEVPPRDATERHPVRPAVNW